ncbi:MAG: hypothetical protein EBT61_11975 [Verrucomicrobia bacterium]|nr:hypothetical protein [Verrucomicrobiota bacterium]
MTSLFLPVGANHPRMLLWLFGGMFALQFTLNFYDQRGFFRTQPARIYGRPQKLLGQWTMPVLNQWQFDLCGLGLLMALAAALAGGLPRASLVLAAVLHLLYFSQITSLSYVQRKPNLLVLGLLILAAAPGLEEPLDRPMPLWPIVLVKLALAQMYFSAAFQKIRRSGWQWTHGETLQAYLAQQYLWTDRTTAWRLATHAGCCRLLGGAVVIWELTFGLILCWPALTPLYVGGAIAFHLGTMIFLRIDYGKYLSPVYMVFLTDTALRACGFREP